MKIGVPKETAEGERRVALVPETVAKLRDRGLEVVVEAGAGRDYNLDGAYREAGARVAESRDEVLGGAEVVAKVQPPSPEEAGRLRDGALVVSFLPPHAHPELVRTLADRGVSAFSMDLIPRIARAQSMDALSSMSSIGGYKASLIAANDLGKYLPMMTTAAGTTRAAQVLVLGAGVAGLQAVATCRRLGAEVTAFDIRPEVKEQIESLGASFLEEERPAPQPSPEDEDLEEGPPTLVDRLREAFGLPPRERVAADGAAPEREAEEQREQVSTEQGYAREQAEDKQRRDRELIKGFLGRVDVVITTALVPGRPAPKLLTEDMVEEMPPGSVVVDLAAEAGGNCALTRAGEVVAHRQVRIHGPLNLPSTVPIHASQLFSRNVLSVLDHLLEDGEPNLDFSDEITAAAVLTHGGEVRHGPTRQALGLPERQPQPG